MKILMFAPIFPPAIGGPATQCFSLCAALLARNEEPVVLTPGERFSHTHDHGYPVYRYRWRYTGTALDKPVRWFVFSGIFLYVLLHEKPAIMHAHSISAPSFIAGAFARLFGIPSIIKFAGDWVWETLSTSRLRGKDFSDIYTSSLTGRLLLAVERRGLRNFDIIWAPSNFRRENALAVLGSDENVRVIPNSLLLPKSSAERMSGSGEFVVISANRFIPHKQVDSIVRAFARLDMPHAQLILIGDGQERERDKVLEEIKRCRVEDKVTLAGLLTSEEVYALFARASVYVSASLEEGFPNVFIEAMHFGLPIVSTDVGGCREMVQEGKTGFLVPPGDVDAMAERVRRLGEDHALRGAFSTAAREAAKQYDLTTVVEQFIGLYRSLARN